MSGGGSEGGGSERGGARPEQPRAEEAPGAEAPARHPDLVQLTLRRPTLGARVHARVAADARDLTGLANRVGRSVREGRIACECEDILVAEITRALDEGASSLGQIVARTGVGTGLCGGARCLDAIALHAARRCGRPAAALLEEAATLVPSTGGPDLGLARITLAYARLGDDELDEAPDDDDEPELVVRRTRRRRG